MREGASYMKKKLIVVIAVFSILAIGLGSYFGYLYSNTNKWTNLVYPGVKIEDVDVSGKTLEEAKVLINEKYGAEILKKNITIKTAAKAYSLDYAKLNAKYDIEEVVKKAFDYGKSNNLIEKYKIIKAAKEYKLNLKFVYDPKPVNELIAAMKKEIDITPVDGSISFSDGKFSVVADKKGAKLNDTELSKTILSKINGDVKSPNISVDAPIEVLQANLTKEKLDTLNTKISSYTTNFSTSSYERSTNITLATKSINGKLLMPGQEFSFNQTVGQRTSARGYQVAPVIVGTKVEADFGGGICQVSTTLYNAVIRANIIASERHPHTMPSHYMGPAMDATVDWGNLDYKFVNTLAFPVYIEAYVNNKNIYFNIYSNSSLTNRTYDMVNEVYATIQPGVKYVDDPTMPEGQTAQEQSPSVGIKAKAYKNTYENGKLIEHKQIADDYYKPIDEIIKKGTKKN